MVKVTIQTVPLDKITLDGYQRDEYPGHVDKIVRGFDLAQWDLPKLVAKEDGSYRAVAGQHRVQVARRLADEHRWPFETPVGQIEAQVVAGYADEADEARLFMHDARNKKPLSAYDRHRAAQKAGERQALEVQAALDGAGIRLVKRQARKTGSTLVAVTALYRIWERGERVGAGDGATLLRKTLYLASLWSADDIFRFEGLLLQGLAIVVLEIASVGGKFTRLERTVKKIPAITYTGMAQKWSVLNGGAGKFTNTPMPYAAVIRESLS